MIINNSFYMPGAVLASGPSFEKGRLFLSKEADKYSQRIYNCIFKFTEEVLHLKILRPVNKRRIPIENELERNIILDDYDIALSSKKQAAFDRLNKLKEEMSHLLNNVPSAFKCDLNVKKSMQRVAGLLNHIDLYAEIILNAQCLSNLSSVQNENAFYGIDELIFYIENHPEQLEGLKSGHFLAEQKEAWVNLLDNFYTVITTTAAITNEWDIMETSSSHSMAGQTALVLGTPSSLDASLSLELEALYATLKNLKILKQKAKLYGVDSRDVQWRIVQTKTKINFKRGVHFDKIGKGANGALLVKWNDKKIAVLKLGEGVKPRYIEACLSEIASSSFTLNGATQWLGICTKTSQKAVICGAGSKNREACAEKAAFMIADKLRQAIISYRNELIKMRTSPDIIDSDVFTPMVAGMIDLDNSSSSAASMALFVKNAIDAEVAHNITGILNKTLCQAELERFQIFVIYDYLVGHTDRHLGNWMVKLSYKQTPAEEQAEKKAQSHGKENDLEKRRFTGFSSSFYELPNQASQRIKVKGGEDLIKLQQQKKFSPEIYTIDKIIPIDNGNILPIEECGYRILDSKQYNWKNLPFASEPFTTRIIDFIAHLPLDDAWIDDICKEINDDPHIKSMSYDIGGIFIKKESSVQMKRRAKNLKNIVAKGIKTPKQLAEASLPV